MIPLVSRIYPGKRCQSATLIFDQCADVMVAEALAAAINPFRFRLFFRPPSDRRQGDCLILPYLKGETIQRLLIALGVDARLRAQVVFARASAAGSLLALAVLSWMPGSYLVRTGVLSGQQEHFLAYFLSGCTVGLATRGFSQFQIACAFWCYAGVLELGQLAVPCATCRVRGLLSERSWSSGRDRHNRRAAPRKVGTTEDACTVRRFSRAPRRLAPTERRSPTR